MQKAMEKILGSENVENEEKKLRWGKFLNFCTHKEVY